MTIREIIKRVILKDGDLKMNIVAIGANPDDVEIGAAGTLAKRVSEGDKAYILHMINTGYDDPITDQMWRTTDETIDRAQRAADIIGAEMHMLPYKDRQVPFNEESVMLIDKFLREHAIDTVYTHWSGDSHQDHINTHKTVMAAARYIKNVFLFEQIPAPRLGVSFIEPRYYVDITEYMDVKIKVLNIYKSLSKYGENFINGIKALAQYRGMQCQVKYAEAFEVAKVVVQ